MNLIPWVRRGHTVSRGVAGTLFTDFRSEFDDLCEFLGERLTGRRGGPGWVWPIFDVIEDADAITIRAEIPGVDKDDLHVTLAGHVLTIAGEKRECAADEAAEYSHSERCFGSFRRSVELPLSADLDRIDAHQENGVLTLRVARVPVTRAKDVEIRSPNNGKHGKKAKVHVGSGAR